MLCSQVPVLCYLLHLLTDIVYACVAVAIINKFAISPGDGDNYCGKEVVGVTCLDGNLHVLLSRDATQANEGFSKVVVYSAEDYRLLRRLSRVILPRGFQSHSNNDITSCDAHKGLYISEYLNNRLHGYDLNAIDRSQDAGGITEMWSVQVPAPRGLSLTPRCNLLVMCGGEPNKLLELSVDGGNRVREIVLPSEITSPWHGVQLANGQFVVCHGDKEGELHRVCMVNSDGRVTRTYGGRRGYDLGQLNSPRHLAADTGSQHIFVADANNNRLVVLSPMLECVRCDRVSLPHRLYLDHPSRRLFVGQPDGDVTVFKLHTVV